MRSLIKPVIFVIGIALLTMFSQCNKDRIELDKNSYESLNDYLDSKKQEEQDFLIDTGGTCPITGNQGTRVCPSKTAIQHSNGDSVYFPYYMHLIELYTVKDMIYYQLSDFGSGGLLESEAVIRLRASKDGDDLSMRSTGTWSVEEPNASPVAGKGIFYSSDGSNWSDSGDDWATSAYGYDGSVTQLSWTSCAGGPTSAVTNQSVSFTSDTDILDNVLIYIYLPNLKALVKVSNQTSIGLPVGEDIEIIMFGIRSNNDLYQWNKSTTVASEGNEYNVELSKVSDSELTSLLDNLQ